MLEQNDIVSHRGTEYEAPRMVDRRGVVGSVSAQIGIEFNIIAVVLQKHAQRQIEVGAFYLRESLSTDFSSAVLIQHTKFQHITNMRIHPPKLHGQ